MLCVGVHLCIEIHIKHMTFINRYELCLKYRPTEGFLNKYAPVCRLPYKVLLWNN
jgi:hypothetical protein